jgi:hypothetical protein
VAEEAVEAEEGKKDDEREWELLLLLGTGGFGDGLRKEGRLMSGSLGRRGRHPHPVSTTATCRHRPPTANCLPPPPPRRALDDVDMAGPRCQGQAAELKLV